ncbi:hypothetical protein H0H93_013869 [Arthromyces matolae]|nr:hypothetical protein H0H93_013869 [Arthromyces matolae]
MPSQFYGQRLLALLKRFKLDNLFALVIGINNYSKRPLAHAVSDADEVERWLLSDLGVPSKNVTSLRNEQATGKGIRDSFQLILDNNDLVADDTVIIYFAGHGSTANAPDDWPTRNGKMQMLLPYDFDVNLSTDAEGLTVCCIIFSGVAHIQVSVLQQDRGRNLVAEFLT